MPITRVNVAPCQVVDLEGLANHRGSILGDLPGQPQPTQKLFESRIWAAFQNFSAARPVYLEWESNRLGRLRLPESLVDSMRWAPLIEVRICQLARCVRWNGRGEVFGVSNIGQ